jgi:hypothetical protein
VENINESQDSHIRIEYLSKPAQLSNVEQLKMLQYQFASKRQDIQHLHEYLTSKLSELTEMVKQEQRFFGELAFELLEQHWVLQSRNWNNSTGILYVNYGYRNGLLISFRWISLS